MRPTLQEDRAAELYAENFMLLDLDNARAWLESNPLLEAFWMGIARGESSISPGRDVAMQYRSECSVNARRRDI